MANYINNSVGNPSSMDAVDPNLHANAYLNVYVRNLIEKHEKANHDTIDFQREYTSALMEMMRGLEVMGADDKVHDDIEVMHGTVERAIAKLKKERNLRLPIVSISVIDMELDMARRRPDFNIVVEKLYDPEKRRAQRIVSLAPKAVTLQYRVSIYDRYIENINQMMEQVELMFHPHGTIKTKHGNSTMGYIVDWADQSIAVAGDKENRVLQKSCIIAMEAYLPTKKYLMTSTGKIRSLVTDEIIS